MDPTIVTYTIGGNLRKDGADDLREAAREIEIAGGVTGKGFGKWDQTPLTAKAFLDLIDASKAGQVSVLATLKNGHDRIGGNLYRAGLDYHGTDHSTDGKIIRQQRYIRNGLFVSDNQGRLSHDFAEVWKGHEHPSLSPPNVEWLVESQVAPETIVLWLAAWHRQATQLWTITPLDVRMTQEPVPQPA